MTATASPTLRWSSVRDCPRKAVYEATNAPARDRTDKEERILYRGKSIGRDYVAFLQARYPDAKIETERKVIWPMGVGHIDVYFPETRTAIEVLSSAHASEAMRHSKLLQLVGYIEHDPDAQNGALIILNPSDFTEERFILSPDSQTYAALVAEMNDRIGQVLAWRDSGDVPARVCVKPGDARSHFCLHAEHCFEGWVAPEPPAVDNPDARLAAHELFQRKQFERELRVKLAEAETDRKQAEQRLADMIDEPGTYTVGPYQVRRQHTQRGPTFDWKKAEMDGRFSPVDLAEFFKAGAAFDTWHIDRANDGAAVDAESFGEVPF